jgi:ABC-2 type transport system permease protein
VSVASARRPEGSAARSPATPAAPGPATAVRAVVRRGLRDSRSAPLTWGGSLGLMSALIAALYPSIQRGLSDAIRSYPSGLKEAFGIGQLDTLEAYLHAEMFSIIVPVAVAVFAIRCASAPIAAAEERGYLATVLSAPLSRRALTAGTFATTALATPAVLVVCGALTLAAAVVSGQDLSVAHLAAALVGVWALALFFAGVAILAAGCSHRAAPVTAVSVGVLVVMYLLDVVGKLADSLGWLRSLSAFRYYGEPLLDGLSAGRAAGLVLAGALLAALGALQFERRDVFG